ncbi:MAG: class I SAM-dependent methyltransferase [Erysipelotrichaceae bacterium]
MILSKRLLTIASLIKPHSIVGDVGCDHAKLLIYLVQNNLIEKGYALDIAQGPLNQAISNIQSENLSEKIIPILSDGLDKCPSDVNCIVIAGMGYDTIKSILLNNQFVTDQLIIQCNSKVYELRSLLSQLNYRIIDEIMVNEGKHYYQMIVCDMTKNGNYNEDELYFGPILLKKRDGIFLKYYQNQLAVLLNIQKTYKDDEINRQIKNIQSMLNVSK